MLEEAKDPATPLLERCRFSAIVASNLDEYFMVRVASLMSRVDAGEVKADHSGMSPAETLKAVSQKIHSMALEQDENLQKSVLPLAREQGIAILSF